jgi:hypothetical protein
MRRATALLALLALLLGACGKYGPPVRSQPAPSSTAGGSASSTTAATPSDDEKQEKAP